MAEERAAIPCVYGKYSWLPPNKRWVNVARDPPNPPSADKRRGGQARDPNRWELGAWGYLIVGA
jgi:hypothetical protein